MVQYKQAMGLRRHSGQIVKDMSLIVVGSLLFSVSMNCIILPSGMYSGGFLGIAQLLRMVLLSVFPSLQSVGDVAGIIYFLLNVPLLILAWSRFGHLFFAKTALCVACYSIFLALIPIPHSGLFDEHLTACVIGGLACGAGAGLTLTSGCSGGGEEILGLLCLQKHPLLSVGRISMALNFAVYGVGFLFFDRQVVVYSILFTCVTFLCLDRAHLQNVMVTMLIITKSRRWSSWSLNMWAAALQNGREKGRTAESRRRCFSQWSPKRKLFSFVRRCRSRTQTSLSFWMTTSQW